LHSFPSSWYIHCFWRTNKIWFGKPMIVCNLSIFWFITLPLCTSLHPHPPLPAVLNSW
jgi:hypothetical protein